MLERWGLQVTIKILHYIIFTSSFADSILLHLLLIWNLVSPSLRLRRYQSGLKQGLLTKGGLVHTFSLFTSLAAFVITAVMLGYQSVFFLPAPLLFTTIALFVIRSVGEKEFRTWSLGSKVAFCFLASIFPMSTPRRPPKVNNLVFMDLCIRPQGKRLLQGKL